MKKTITSLFFFFFCIMHLHAEVFVGADVLFEDEKFFKLLDNKRVGLISNHTAIDKNFKTTFELLKNHAGSYKVAALFTPEHGFFGDAYADEKINDGLLGGTIIHSLYGKTRRPTAQMLQNIDLLIFDIQDIGSRSYTYISTLFYCMEEASLHGVPIMVLDRPNPIGGLVVDGPPLEKKWRSFVGYINVPYCHGMTIGELAKLFNEEYAINAELTVVPMKGWKRWMSFKETALPWVPTSPQIPESDTPFYYPTTGIIGQMSLLSIGVGYTLPFKILGAPWIRADEFAVALNNQKLPGVHFYPYHFCPFFGKFNHEKCYGVKIVVTDKLVYLPVTTQFTILGILKTLYSKEVSSAIAALNASKEPKNMFHRINGTEEIFNIISEQKFFIWSLRDIFRKERVAFLERRKKFLISSYN